MHVHWNQVRRAFCMCITLYQVWCTSFMWPWCHTKHSIHAHTHEGSVSFLPASNTNVGRLMQPHLTVIELKLGSMLLSKMPLGIVNCLFLWRTNIRESEPCSVDTYMGSSNSTTLVQPRALHYGNTRCSHITCVIETERSRAQWMISYVCYVRVTTLDCTLTKKHCLRLYGVQYNSLTVVHHHTGMYLTWKGTVDWGLTGQWCPCQYSGSG